MKYRLKECLIFKFLQTILTLPKQSSHKSAYLQACIHFSTQYTYTDVRKQNKGKGKGKAVTLQAWNGPEGSRKLRFPDFMKMARNDGKFVSLRHRLPLLTYSMEQGPS
jgi:hypothetical protein